MIRILCYGDSNTWGYISGTDHLRYGENERWTRVLKNKLDENYEVIEEGLNSRTLKSDDPRKGKEGRNGYHFLKPCMYTHDKFDCFVLMLGTNDTKTFFNHSGDDIFSMMKEYIEIITNYKSQIDGSSPKLIVCGIPPISDIANNNPNDNFFGAKVKAIRYKLLIKNYCQQNNIPFIDNSDLETGIDGLHITKESHTKLAEKIYNAIIKLNL